ncbi:hypothetical protein TrVFT333_009709 [Trichoderma virens FT-333]|nr:hypothetical protein TrVFT333_009709 [Trichoderma virens FT-333]
MGSNLGNGMNGMDLSGAMQGNGSNQPQATEYTLQGVMRFLQTEWHRHERDRNAWEIEKQEMKGRIANLEGQARRADATQKALKKYVSILERKIKDQAAQLKGTAVAEADDSANNDRAAKIQEKLRSSSESQPVPGVEGVEVERTDDESQRTELKTFLDQCQSEFMYLMITPANPLPPRESPRCRFWKIYERPRRLTAPRPKLSTADAAAPSKFAPNAPEMQPQMVRSVNEHQQQSLFHNSNEWQQQQQQQQPISVTTRPVEDGMPRSNHSNETLGGIEESVELREKPPAAPDPEGWEFPDGSFPEPAAGHPPSQTSSYRSDTDAFPNADYLSKSPSRVPGTHRRKSSMSKRRGSDHDVGASQKAESASFKLRFGLRGHLNTVRTVIFSGGGSPGEPEICTAGDDGMIKRFHIPRLDGNAAASNNAASDLDVTANFTHRGHNGAVLSLASWSPAPNFSTGGRAQGDGWIFSGGQDATIRVWERGRVDPKATLEGHTDAVWAICVLPTTLGSVFGSSSNYGSPDRILLVSGAADGTVRLWSVSAPPQLSSPQPGSTRAASGRGGRVRGNSMSSGSGFSNSPQPTVASNSPFNHTLVHVLSRQDGSKASPTCITPLGSSGETFVVSYSDAAVLVYDTKTGEQVGYMDSLETYDGSIKTSVNAVVATTIGLDQGNQHHGTNIGGEEDPAMGGPTGGRSMAGSGVEGTIISGHEDRFVRFFDANSGQCTYNMLAHPDAISSLSLSPDGRELVSAGHDASLRFWSLEKRSCIQEITSHRVMRGEGICTCVWSQDGKWVVSGGGDGIVKVFAR